MSFKAHEIAFNFSFNLDPRFGDLDIAEGKEEEEEEVEDAFEEFSFSVPDMSLDLMSELESKWKAEDEKEDSDETEEDSDDTKEDKQQVGNQRMKTVFHFTIIYCK